MRARGREPYGSGRHRNEFFWLGLIALGLSSVVTVSSVVRANQNTPADPSAPTAVPADAEQPASAAVSPDGSADEPASAPAVGLRRGYLVPVLLPITGDEDTRLKRTIDKLLSELPVEGARPVLVLEFRTRVGQAGEASQFERSLSLARYLAGPRLSRVKTVAYMPADVRGHAVLVAMACENLMLSPDARFGEAGVGEEFIDPTMRRGYAEIASRRRTLPEAVALGMLDKQLGVYRARTLDGTRYVLDEELRQLQEQAAVSEVQTVSPAGDFLSLTGDQLREMGFASHLVADRQQLAAAVDVPIGSLEEDPSLLAGWRAARIELRGRITASLVNQTLRSIEEARRRQEFNFLCVWIDSPGGSPADSIRLAQALAELDASEVRTVAFVSDQARSDAALPALACDHLVLVESGLLGGPGDHQPGTEELENLRQPVQQLAAAKGRDWSLMLGLVDRRVDVYRFRQEGTGQVRYLSEEEADGLAGWQRGEPLDLRRGLLAREAESLGLARAVVRDFGEFVPMYNLEQEPQTIEAPWAEAAVERLAAQPWFARTLLFVAFFALMTEASKPGLGAAGFVSGLCFLLFFWSQFLNGNAGWLEVLLFLGGVACIAIELFAIPGFGIFGIGGGLMIIVSIVLASQTFVLPQNSYQFQQLPASLSMVVIGGAGAVASLVFVRRVMPYVPVLNRVMLPPPEPEELDRREALVSWSHLQGKRGTTTTRLNPAGKARFGDEIVDVLSDGELLPAGTAVYVAEVRGNRVLVVPIHQPPTV